MIAIRPALPSDIAPLDLLDRAHWTPKTTSAPLPMPAPGFGTKIPLEDVIVAEDSETGAVVGYVNIGPRTDLPSHAHVGRIRSLLVDREQRGRGVGRRLVDAALEAARERGWRKLGLRVLGTNTEARALYRAAGFVEEGRLVDEFELEGRYVDDLFLARFL